MKLYDIYIIPLFVIMSLSGYSCVDEGGGGETEIIEHVVVGSTVPEFRITAPDGSVFSSEEFYGKKSILLFFVTTCGDCQRVLPVLEEAYGKMESEGDYMMVTISRGESGEAVAGYWESKGYTMPWYIDPYRNVYSLFANSYVPRIYVINPSGIVTAMFVEVLPLDADGLLDLLKSAN